MGPVTRSLTLRAARVVGALAAILAVSVLILLAAYVVPLAFAVACLAALTVACAVLYVWAWVDREEGKGGADRPAER